MEPKSGVHDHSIIPRVGSLPLAATYTGIAFLILAPRWFRGSIWTLAALALLCATGNLLLGVGEIKPMMALVNGFVPSLASMYGRLVYGVFAAVGVWFLVSTVQNGWDRRRERFFVFLAVALLASLAATMKVTVQFSSRYVVTSLPVVVVLAQQYGPLTRVKSLRLLVGILSYWAPCRSMGITGSRLIFKNDNLHLTTFAKPYF